MHEIGLCEAILEAVEARAAGRPVARVRVHVGAMHRVSEPALDQAFQLVSGGSVAEGASVDLVVVPVHMLCNACGAATSSDDAHAVCGSCGSPDVELTGGDELLLESIEMKVPA